MDPKHILIVVFIFVAGLFSLISSIKNWDWFFEHRKARLLAHVLGRMGARIFYGSLGLMLIGLGIYLLLVPNAQVQIANP